MRGCPTCHLLYTTDVSRCGLHGDELVGFDDDPFLGEQLDRYQIDRRLGAGAMGCVYHATHSTLTSRTYALKVLFGEYACRRQFVARLRREAEVASQMDHPNIVPTVDYGTTPQGVTFLVMEYRPGRTVAELIRAEAPLPFARAAKITAEIAGGLAHAHERGFIHRDIKNGNVLLVQSDDDEAAQILDFGVVDVASSAMDATKLTGTGVALGTPAYMAPEQMRGDPAQPSMDIYGLGVMLYTMIEGRRPFAGAMAEVVRKKLAGPPPTPMECGGLEHLAMRMLDLDPGRRPTAAEVIDLIEHVQGGGALTAAPPGPATERMIAAAGVRRRWISWLFAAAAGALALLAIVVGPDPASSPVTTPIDAPSPAPSEPALPALVAPPPRQPVRRSPPAAPAVHAEPETSATPPIGGTGYMNVVVTRGTGFRAAQVRVDGRPRGETPLRIEVPAGDRRIEIRGHSGAPILRMVTVEAGQTVRVVFQD